MVAARSRAGYDIDATRPTTSGNDRLKLFFAFRFRVVRVCEVSVLQPGEFVERSGRLTDHSMQVCVCVLMCILGVISIFFASEQRLRASSAFASLARDTIRRDMIKLLLLVS